MTASTHRPYSDKAPRLCPCCDLPLEPDEDFCQEECERVYHTNEDDPRENR